MKQRITHIDTHYCNSAVLSKISQTPALLIAVRIAVVFDAGSILGAISGAGSRCAYFGVGDPVN
jgi:hypothetical protein